LPFFGGPSPRRTCRRARKAASHRRSGQARAPLLAMSDEEDEDDEEFVDEDSHHSVPDRKPSFTIMIQHHSPKHSQQVNVHFGRTSLQSPMSVSHNHKPMMPTSVPPLAALKASSDASIFLMPSSKKSHDKRPPMPPSPKRTGSDGSLSLSGLIKGLSMDASLSTVNGIAMSDQTHNISFISRCSSWTTVNLDRQEGVDSEEADTSLNLVPNSPMSACPPHDADNEEIEDHVVIDIFNNAFEEDHDWEREMVMEFKEEVKNDSYPFSLASQSSIQSLYSISEH
jgi:hypothetical protein